METKETIKPIAIPVKNGYLLNKYYMYFCECGHTLQTDYNFCPCCGKELNWDEDND